MSDGKMLRKFGTRNNSAEMGENMKNRIRSFILDNKIIIFSIMLIVSFTYIIRNDYVAVDAFVEPSDEYSFVTADRPLEIPISSGGSKLYSILLSVQNPSELLEGVGTTISLCEENQVISSLDLDNNSYVDVTDSRGNATEFVFGDVVKLKSGRTYSIRITSNVDDVTNAFGFRMDKNGAVWSRLTYLLLTKAQRKWVFAIGAAFLTTIVYILAFKKKQFLFCKPENFFLLSSGILCLMYLIFIPIFQTPDEVNHYVRAYGIAHGYFLTPAGGELPIPQNLIPYEWYTYSPFILFKNFHMEIDPANAILHNNVNMALYSPLSYVLQAVGIRIADIFCNNTYILVLAGSFFNMAGCTLLLYYAIKYIPYGKGVITMISLLPMALQERASLSVDAITYAVVVAFLAFCLYMREQKVKMTRGQFGLMYGLIVLVSSCKVVYFVAAFAVLLIPRESFGNQKRERLHKTASLFLTILLSFGWLAAAWGYLGDTQGGGSASEKLRFMLTSFGRYLYILDKTFWEQGEGFVFEMLGLKLGSMDILINNMLILMIILLLGKMYYGEKVMRKNPDYVVEIFTLTIGVGMILLIATSLYIQWTVPAASTYSIEGIQGRYFLPVLPFVLCGLLSKKGTGCYENELVKKTAFVLYVINLTVLMDVLAYSSYVG